MFENIEQMIGLLSTVLRIEELYCLLDLTEADSARRKIIRIHQTINQAEQMSVLDVRAQCLLWH